MWKETINPLLSNLIFDEADHEDVKDFISTELDKQTKEAYNKGYEQAKRDGEQLYICPRSCCKDKGDSE